MTDRVSNHGLKSEKRKTRVIAFVNNKGGSSKTTSCSNIGYELSKSGKNVLLIDGDMQLNLSLSFFREEIVLEISKGEKNLYKAVAQGKSLQDYIIHTSYERLDMIVSSTMLYSIDDKKTIKSERMSLIKNSMNEIIITGFYDYILIDSPPTLGWWVMNILCASSDLIIPVEASPWGLFGLANFFEFLQENKKHVPDLNLLGVVMTRVDQRKNYVRLVKETLLNLKSTRIFDNCIHVDSSIEWAQENCMPVSVYKQKSRSAKEYRLLAQEVEKYVNQ